MKKKFLEGGKIVSTHGIRGEVKVNYWCDDPYELTSLKYFYFDEGKEKIKVEKLRVNKNQLIVKLEGVNNPDEAQNLRGRVLYIDRNDLSLGEREYFIADIIGLKVIDAETDEEYGTLCDVSFTGANDVYHIKFSDGKQKLIPAIPQVVIETDIDSGVMKIKPMAGLFDDED